MAAWDLPDGPVTIMFTDVAGSTALNTRLGDDATRPLLRDIEATIRGQLEGHGGREVKGTGDGHLVWFASARRAVACAVAIQRALAGSELQVRIGLTTGEVTAEGGDLYGEAVNLAARVAAKAEGGEILVADVVRQLTGTLGGAAYRERGRFKLKGFPERVRLFAVDWTPAPVATAGRPTALPLVGRRSEVAAVRSLVDRFADGRGGVLLVEGEAGIGKTRLALEAVGLAERRGATVLRGVAADVDRTQPFRAVAEALGAVRGSRDERRRAIADRLVSDASAAGFRIREACVDLVEQLALQAPVLLVLEDAHWADPSSLDVLRLLASSTNDLPLGILVTLRPTPRRAELQGFLDAVAAEGHDSLALPPLDAAAQRQLATEAVGGSLDAGLEQQLAKTAGNPLYVIELARASAAGDPDEASSTLRTTILRRLLHLPDATVEALRIASVLGSSFTLADLATASGQRAVSLVPVLREAIAAQVVVETGVGLAFRHDLIRESLYEDLPATVRKALHAEIGRALAAAGAPAGVVAPHLVAGADAGDQEAVDGIVRAAREASVRSIAAGAELLEQAIALCPRSSPVHGELEAELVSALAWGGQADAAIERGRAALARHPARRVELELRFAIGEAYLASARSHLGNEIGREVLALGVDGLERARALILAHYGVASPEAAAGALEARQLAEAAGDPTAVGLARLVQAFPASYARDWTTLDEHLRAALDAFDAAASPVAERYRLHAIAWRAWLLELLGRTEEGALARREARRRAEELGADAMLNSFDNDDAVALQRAGRLHDARTIIEGVVDRQDRRGFGGAEAPAMLAQIGLLIGAPDADRLVERIDAHPNHAPLVRALQAHARGDHDAALDLLVPAFAMVKANGWGWPADAVSPPMIRSALATGRLAEVEPVVVDAEAEAAMAGAAPAAQAMAWWCRGLAARDASLLRRALEHPSAAARPLDRAFALEDLAGVLLERGETAEAVTALQESLSLFERLDVSPSVARVAARLRALGVRRGAKGTRVRASTGWASITPSEHAVIELVAAGRTNPQIAKQLYVSRHTVESHLKHVYAKLGLSSRVELAAAHARRDIPEPGDVSGPG